MRIRQTSPEEYGQIYVPVVNWAMMVITIALVVSFGTSSRLAGAYGTAVSTTMLLTSVLLYYAMRQVWRWPLMLVLPLAAVFLVVDLVFFAANLLKIGDGGWIPLLLALVLFGVMTTWRAGIDALRRAQNRQSESLANFLHEIARNKGEPVPGTAVFLTRIPQRVPPLILQHVRQIGAISQTMVAMTIRFVDRPRIAPAQKVELRQLGPSFWHLTVRFGYFELPNVPATFARACRKFPNALSLDEPTYFAARDEIVPKRDAPFWWRLRMAVFALMTRNAVHLVDRFSFPPASLIEIGRRIEL